MVIDHGWRFRASKIRSDVAKGDYTSFKQYVEEALSKEESCQFLADGQEYLPQLTGEALQDLVTDLDNFRYVIALDVMDIRMLFIGRTMKAVKTRTKREIIKLIEEGHIPPMAIEDAASNDN